MPRTWDEFWQHAHRPKAFKWNECWEAKHPHRVRNWRINKVTPSNHETEVMDRVGVAQIEIVRSFLAWRRTTFVAALPILFLSAYLGATALPFMGEEEYSSLGIFVSILPWLGVWIMFGFSVAAVWRWSDWNKSAFLLKIGWGVSFVLTLIPALFSLETLMDPNHVEQLKNGDDEEKAIFATKKMLAAVHYILKISPVVLSFPGGAMKGAVRVRALLPDSSLTSWILAISAPFYSVLILMALVVTLQLAGNALLFCGALLLTLNPLVYVVFRQLLASAPTPEVDKKLDIMQQCVDISNLVGLILIILYIVFYVDIDQYDIDKVHIVQFAVIGWGRMIVTTLLFCDIFFWMTITNWKEDDERRRSDQCRIDNLFQSLETRVIKCVTFSDSTHGTVPKGVTQQESGSEADGSEADGSEVEEDGDEEHKEQIHQQPENLMNKNGKTTRNEQTEVEEFLLDPDMADVEVPTCEPHHDDCHQHHP